MSKTTRPMTTELFSETGEVIERELNDSEMAQYEADLAAQSAKIAESEAKEAARLATIEKLAALGLTPEDLAAL